MTAALIEAFKIIRGFVDYGQNFFKLSRSKLKIISQASKTTCASRREFLSERVRNYWNVLPNYVKMSPSVNSFKANLEKHKVHSIANKYNDSVDQFWEISDHVLSRIKSPSYVAGRPAFCE